MGMGGGMQMGNLGMNNMGFDTGPDWAGTPMGGPGPGLGGMGGVFFCGSLHPFLRFSVIPTVYLSSVSCVCLSPRIFTYLIFFMYFHVSDFFLNLICFFLCVSGMLSNMGGVMGRNMMNAGFNPSNPGFQPSIHAPAFTPL